MSPAVSPAQRAQSSHQVPGLRCAVSRHVSADPVAGALLVVGEEPGLRARRVDDAGDVPAAAEHEPHRPADQRRGLVRRLPRHDVVVDRADDVGRRLDRAQVDDAARDLQRARGQLVPDVEVAQVERVHRGRHPGAVGVPGQDVERRRVLAHQPVAHHVVEDQVVGPQDVERAGHRGALEGAGLGDLLDQLLDGLLVGEVAQHARLGVVEHRVEQGQRADPAVAALGEVGGGDRGQRAAQAQPDDVDRLGAGDLARSRPARSVGPCTR